MSLIVREAEIVSYFSFDIGIKKGDYVYMSNIITNQKTNGD